MCTSIHRYLLVRELESLLSRSTPFFDPFLVLLLPGSLASVGSTPWSTPITESRLFGAVSDFKPTWLLACRLCMQLLSPGEWLCSSEESAGPPSASSFSVTGLSPSLTSWGLDRVSTAAGDCSWGCGLLCGWLESAAAEELLASALCGRTAATLGAWDDELRGPPLETRVQVMSAMGTWVQVMSALETRVQVMSALETRVQVMSALETRVQVMSAQLGHSCGTFSLSYFRVKCSQPPCPAVSLSLSSLLFVLVFVWR